MSKRDFAVRTCLALMLGVLSACRAQPNSSPSPALGDRAAFVSITDLQGRQVVWSDEAAQHRDDSILNVRLTPQQVRELEDVCALARTHFLQGEWNNFGPDSGYREIVIFCRAGQFILRSWHPIVERNPFLVAASYGVSTLGGKSREQLLREDDPDYISKRNAFDEIERELVRRFGD